MENKIIEVFKKYSKSVDTKYNVYNCLIEEDWSNIAREVVNKIVAKPVLCGDSEQFYCWDEEALGAGSRCKAECDICKNKGQQ